MSLSRREFLHVVTYGSAAAAMLPTTGCTTRISAAQIAANITFMINFSGPMAFLENEKEPDYIYVYSPKTSAIHYPVVTADNGDHQLKDSADLALMGITPQKATQKINPAFTVKIDNAMTNAYGACRIGIKMPRPNIIKGVHPAKVEIDSRVLCEPTGFRFIYNAVPTTAKPTIDGFSPKFHSADPVWEMDIRVIPKDLIDNSNHDHAKTAFNEVAGMCGLKPIPKLNYKSPDDCDFDKEKSSPYYGPGHDCQVIGVSVITT